MANQKKTQQAKKISSMGAKAGATKAQVAQGQARAGGQSGYKVTNKDVKRAGQAAKIISGAAITVAGPGKFVKAAKAVKGAQAASKLTKEEKLFTDFVKKNAKTAKPGDTALMLGSANLSGRRASAEALRKAAGDRSAVYKPAKQATPVKIKTANGAFDVKKTITGKIKVTNQKTGNSVKLPKNTEVSPKNIKQAVVKKYTGR